MKYLHLLLATLVFGLGAMTGRALFPKESVLPPAPTLSDRSERPARRVVRVEQSGGVELDVSPRNIAGLLELVDPQLYFQTSTKLRAALGGLSADALEGLLGEIETTSKFHPGFHTLRMSLFNHLVARDPFHALDVLLAHGDPHFRNSNINQVMTMAARLDKGAAEDALALFENPALKKAAITALDSTDPDPSVEDLLATLSDQKKVSFQNHYHSFGWSGHYGGVFWNSNANSTLGKLAQKDLAAAESYVAGLESQNQRSNAYGQIASSLAQSDPDGALAFVRSLDPANGRDQHFSTVLSRIAYQDPEKAAGLLGEIENVQSRNNVLSAIANGWMQKDSQAGIAWLDSLPASQAKMNAYSSAAQALGHSDPMTAIALLEKMPGNIRRNTMPQIMAQWASQDFEAARGWVTSQTDPVQIESGFGSIIGSWVAEDPDGAADFLEKAASKMPSFHQSGHFHSVGREWAARDQTSALAWAGSLESDKTRANAFFGIFQQLGQQNPAAAARHLLTMQDNNQRGQLVQRLAGQWAYQDPGATRDWLDTLPTEQKSQAVASALSSLSYSQPLEAVEFMEHFVSQGVSEEKLGHYTENIVGGWSQFAPDEAAQWAAGISSEDKQSQAYHKISENWVQQDAAATAGWIDTLPVGISRDRATSALVDRVSQIDPASAFDWADSINDDGQRMNALQRTFEAWKITNVEEARQAAAGANVTAQQREELLKKLR